MYFSVLIAAWVDDSHSLQRQVRLPFFLKQCTLQFIVSFCSCPQVFELPLGTALPMILVSQQLDEIVLVDW